MLTKIQKFYIEHNRNDKTEAEIAKDVGASVASVRAFIKTIPKAFPPRLQPLAESIAKFGVNNGTVVMTPAQSAEDDETRLATVEKTPRNEEFFAKRTKNAIHKIRPDEPTR